MSYSAESGTVKKVVQQGARIVQQNIPVNAQKVIQQGAQWIQQNIPVNLKGAAQQGTQQHMQSGNGASGFSIGQNGLPTCEVCLTKHSVLVWMVVIAIASIIIWYLMTMLFYWVKGLLNRPRYSSHHNRRRRDDDFGQINDSRSPSRGNWQQSGDTNRRHVPQNQGYDERDRSYGERY